MKKLFFLIMAICSLLFSNAQSASDIDGIYSLSSGRLLRLQYSNGTSTWESQGTYTNTFCGNAFYFDPAYPIIKDMNYVSTNKWTAKTRWYCSIACTYHYLDVDMVLEDSGQSLKRTVTTTTLPCNATSAPTEYWYRALQTSLAKNNLADEAFFNVYYTFASSSIQIHTSSWIDSQFYLYNSEGKLILKAKLEGETNSLKIENHSTGLYFYSILQSNNILKSGKIVVIE